MQPLFSGKIINITQPECASVPMYPACNAHAPYCNVACSALHYFSILSLKWHEFRKNVTESKMCVLIFSTTFV